MNVMKLYSIEYVLSNSQCDVVLFFYILAHGNPFNPQRGMHVPQGHGQQLQSQAVRQPPWQISQLPEATAG